MPWRSRWSSARLSSTPASGAKRSVSSSWNDDASATTIVASGRPCSDSEVSASPTLPATITGTLAVRCRCPISSAVVVFPFEPVTAIVSLGSIRQPSSSSPSTPIPASRAAAITGAWPGTPGLLITVSTPARSSTPGEPACTGTPARSSSSRRPEGTSPESTPTTSAPSARSASAAATPDRARPTTRYGPGGSGGRGSTRRLCRGLRRQPPRSRLPPAGAVPRGRRGRPRTRGPPARGGGGPRQGRRGRCRRCCRRS